MLTIRNAQLETLRLDARRRFHHWLAQHLRTSFPVKSAEMDDPALLAFVERGHDRAEKYGLTRGPSICRFLDLMIVLGEHFEEIAWVKRQLSSTLFGDPNDRVDHLARLAAARSSRRA